MPRRHRTAGLPALLIALTLGAAGSLPAQVNTAPRISEVQFVAPEWLPRESLTALLDLAPGDAYTPESLRAGIQRLLTWSRVSAVVPRMERPRPGEVRVILEIGALSMVQEIHFVGQRHLGPGFLARGVDIAVEDLLRPDDLDAIRDALVAHCQTRGYLYASVVVEAEPLPEAPGNVALYFQIDEGPRATIKAIELHGNREVATSHLLALLHHRRRILFGIISNGYLELDHLEADLETIREYYRRHGYLDVVVALDELDLGERLSEVTVRILIDEGRRYLLERIVVDGHHPALEDGLARQIQSAPGTLYDGDSLERDRRRLVEFYQRRTLRIPSIRIEHRYPLVAHPPRVTAVFKIDEKSHLYVGQVAVRGNRWTRDRVIRSIAGLSPFDPFTEFQLAEAAQRLSASGYFEDVTISSGPAPDRISPFLDDPEDDPRTRAAAVRDVTIEVAEKRTGLFEIGGGASSGAGEIVSIRLSQSNLDIFDWPGGERGWEQPFKGAGQKLQVEVNPGTKITEFRFHFEAPYVHDTRNAITVDVANRAARWRRYDEDLVRGEIGWRHFWDETRRLSSRLVWTIDATELGGFDDGLPPEITQWDDTTILSYPSIRLGYHQDGGTYFSGRRGWHATGRADAGAAVTGSEVDFVRLTASLDHYLPVNPWLNTVLPGEPLARDIADLDHVLHLGARFGWMDGISGDAIPFYDRFFLGGPRSLRGFNYRRVGPHFEDIPIGGEAFWTVTAEYSFPLFLRELRLVALFDAGDIEPTFGELSGSRIRTAAGGGLWLRLRLFGQAFPINLYWVEALSQERQDRERLFTFSLGVEF